MSLTFATKRSRGRTLTVVGYLTVACVLALPTAAFADPGKTFPHATSGAVVLGNAAPRPTKPAPTLVPVVKPPLADQVQLLGEAPQYQASWVGEVTNADGTVTAYVTPPGASAFATGLSHQVGAPSVGYRIVTVARSFSQLDALTSQIAADEASLRAAGFDLDSWGPDVPSDTVKISLDNYTAAAAQALQSRYGSAVSVVPATNPSLIIQPATRDDDTAAWFSGDPLFYNGNKNALCTLGFGFIGNNSGKEFNATAGHCGANGSFNTSYNNNYYLGHTSTNYWTPAASTNDIQSISSPGGFSYEVWYNNTQTHNVIGWGNFGVGQLVTMDGFTTNEKPDWTIQITDDCFSAAHWSDDYERCHIYQAYNASTTACYQGDSGGPVYQRTSNNNVYAAGLIIGGSTNNNHYCYYYGIGAFRTLVNGHMMTASGSGG